MDRKRALNYIDYIFDEEDMIVYIGEVVCSEVTNKDREFVLFFDDKLDYFSLVLGIAMTTNKRIVIVCEDYSILKYFKSVIHIAISQCTNIIILVLKTGEYTLTGGQPTTFDSIRSPKGVFFNIGFLTHDYTNHFKNKSTLNNVITTLNRIKVPVLGIINIDNKRLFEDELPQQDFLDKVLKLREYNATHISTEHS
jgi:hypothetical protein